MLSPLVRAVPYESRTVPFYLETSLSFRCFGNLKRLLFIFLKDSQCHPEAQISNTVLTYVILQTSWPGAGEGNEAPSLPLKPQQYALCPCVVFLFCCQHWRLCSVQDFLENVCSWKNSCWKWCLGASPCLAHSSQRTGSRGRQLVKKEICWYIVSPIVMSIDGKCIRSIRQLSEVGVNTIVVLGGDGCMSSVHSERLRELWTYPLK